MVASHIVIKEAIDRFGKDCRFEDKENPIEILRNRSKDNTTLGKK